MTQEELINAIFDDLVQEAENDHEGSVYLVWLEKMRQKWLKKVRET